MYVVDFVNVSPVGLESSPVVAALAGPRAHLSTTLPRGLTTRMGQSPLRIAKSDSKRDF